MSTVPTRNVVRRHFPGMLKSACGKDIRPGDCHARGWRIEAVRPWQVEARVEPSTLKH